MTKNCECYMPCEHEEQIVISLSIPKSVYNTLQYRHAESPEESIEYDIIQSLSCEDFFSMDMDEYETYIECNKEGQCDGRRGHHHLLDKEKNDHRV